MTDADAVRGPPPERCGSRTRRRLDLLLFALVFLLAGWFYNGYGWNQTARYDPVWAFVEPGPNRWTLRIDDFLVDPAEGLNTGDWARNPERGEHYYSNKAPGTTLLGIPAYLVLYHGERLVGLDPTSIEGVLVNAYLLNLWVTVLPLALSSLFFFRLLVWLGCSRAAAVGYTTLLYAGTLLLPFSTMLWGHTTAAAFVVMATACFFTGGRRGWIWSGLLAGVAVLTDYAAAPFAVGLVGLAAPVPRHRERIGPVLGGATVPLVVFGAYHWALFGSPLRLASSYSPEGMLSEGYVQGLFGGLSLEALQGLTFSTSRGLFVFMPVLLLAFVGVRHMRDHRRAEAGWLALFVVVAVLLVNSTFNGWHGGVSSGPRYQIVALPFWVLLVAFTPGSRAMRRVVVALGAVSVANMLVIAAVSPMAQDALRGSPLLFCWAKLIRVVKIDLGLEALPPPGAPLSAGSLHVYPTLLMRDWAISVAHPLMETYASFNLGERLLGLRRTLSLVPVLAAASVLGWRAVRLARAIDAMDEGEPETGQA